MLQIRERVNLFITAFMLSRNFYFLFFNFDFKETPQCANPLTGEVYKEGEIWSLSECAHCLCGEFQTGNCSVIRCSKPLCDDPFKIKGKCCPVCPQDYARGWCNCNY